MCSEDNILFRKSVLGPKSVILELGCGISGLPGMAVASRVARYIATDQDYVLKLLRRNLKENSIQLSAPPQQKDSLSAKLGQTKVEAITQMQFLELDWESSGLNSLSALLQDSSGSKVDTILACDCIYNDTLIEPLVRTCATLCSQELRDRPSEKTPKAAICIIAQQLRSPEVFQGWLTQFHRRFRVWRFPDNLLNQGLKQGTGYVIHIGCLRDAIF